MIFFSCWDILSSSKIQQTPLKTCFKIKTIMIKNVLLNVNYLFKLKNSKTIYNFKVHVEVTTERRN